MKKLYVLIALLLIFPVSSYALTEENIIEEKESDLKIEVVTLEECVDGDTARFRTSSNEVIKARFLAVDTPETVHPTKGVEPFGKDASNYTCTTLTNAKEIKLEYDNNSDEEDNYGRKLVWVFVDNVLLQDSLVSNGYAEVAYLYDDYKYTSLLQDSEALAKVNKLGIWSIEDSEVDDGENTKVESTIEKKTDENKDFFDKLLDDLLGMIFDFIDELLEKLLKMIEDML